MFKKLLNKFTILFKHNIVINSRWGKRLLFMMLLCAFAGITVLTISNYNLRNEMNTGNQAFVNTFANNIDSILVSNNQTPISNNRRQQNKRLCFGRLFRFQKSGI